MFSKGDKVTFKLAAGGFEGVGEVESASGNVVTVKAKSSTMGKSWWVTLAVHLEKVNDAPKDS